MKNIGDWLKHTEYTRDATNAWGLLSEDHTWLVIPKTEEAELSLLTGYGFVKPEDAEKRNKDWFDNITTPLCSFKAKHLRMMMRENKSCEVLLGRTVLDAGILKKVITKYTRADDMFAVYINEDKEGNYPVRLLTPCKHYWVIIAPRMMDEGVSIDDFPRVSLDDFPMEVLFE